MAESYYYAILVFDIERFGRRSDVDQHWLRTQLRQIIGRVCAESGVPQSDLGWQDTGDGGFFLVPAALPKRLLVDPLVPRLHAALREHNVRSSSEGQLRLRVALHAGDVATDVSIDGSTGYVGRDLNFACRLVDATPLRERLQAHPEAQLVFIVSGVVHRSVIQRGDGAIDASRYVPVRVKAKEVDEIAWIHVPGVVETAQVPSDTTRSSQAPPADPQVPPADPQVPPVGPPSARTAGDGSTGGTAAHDSRPADPPSAGVHIHGPVTAGNDVVMRDKIEYHHEARR
ncbi:hypothetical protein AB0J90_29670 [Micromonospora sp. NPDC049523]|uniref:hypothetical protein n=1 Tax=Micromonospora sp. NPDC049523 TaxID=3155921 RepID=UPI00344402DF